MSPGSFENNISSKLFLKIMYKQYLALNNLQWLIGHKIQPTNQLNNLQWLIGHKIQPTN